MKFETYMMLPLTLAVIFSGILVFYYLNIKHKERMELLKNGSGLDTKISLLVLKYSVLSKGIFLISIGIGIAIARVLTLEFEVLNDFSTYLIALLLSGGIGLILYYKIIKKENHL